MLSFNESNVSVTIVSEAGKSCLVHSFVMDNYEREYGVIDLSIEDEFRKQIEVKGMGTVSLCILDTDTRNDFAVWWKDYWIKDSDVVAFCFAIDDADWMDEVISDIERILCAFVLEYHNKGIVLIGCKMDKMYDMKTTNEDERAMMEANRKRAIEFSQERNIPYIETSARADTNIDEVFQQIVYEYWLQMHSDSIRW